MNKVVESAYLTKADKWTFIFLDDGTTEEYNQETFDYEEVGVEVISESR